MGDGWTPNSDVRLSGSPAHDSARYAAPGPACRPPDCSLPQVTARAVLSPAHCSSQKQGACLALFPSCRQACKPAASFSSFFFVSFTTCSSITIVQVSLEGDAGQVGRVWAPCLLLGLREVKRCCCCLRDLESHGGVVTVCAGGGRRQGEAAFETVSAKLVKQERDASHACVCSGFFVAAHSIK